MIGSSHSKYSRNALLNNKSIQCYVDLGSSYVTLKNDAVKDLGFTYFHTYKCVSSFGNGLVKPLGLFTENLCIDTVTVKVNHPDK